MARNRTANISGELITNTIIVTSSGANVSNALVKTGDTMTGELNVANNLVVTGNVGIGTSSPNGLLHLSGSTATTTAPSIIFQDTGTTSTRLGSITNDNGDLVLAMTSSLTDLRAAVTLFDDRKITFTTAAQERMRLDSSGNFGIGTSSPAYKLDTNTASTGTIARFVNGTGRGYVRMDGYDDMTLQFYRQGASIGFLQTDGSGTEFLGGTTNAYPFIFYTNNTEKMRLTSAGDVGIGTSSPTYKLDVSIGSTDGVNGTVANSYPIALFTNRSSGGGNRGFEIGAPTGSVVSPVYIKVYATSARFSILNNANTEQFTILNDGNVGIGTANPTEKLHIGSGQSNFIRIHNAGSGDVSSGISITRGDSLGFQIYDNPSDQISTINAANGINFRTESTSYRVFISGAGNVGIGTSSPVSNDLTGALTIYKVHNNDSASIPSTTAQAYNENQSALYLFGRNSGLTIVSEYDEGGSIIFADNDRRNSGAIEYSHTTDALAFSTNGSSRVLIDNTGRSTFTSTSTSAQFVNVLTLKTSSTDDYHPAILFENNRNSVINQAQIAMDSSPTAGTSDLRYTVNNLQRWFTGDNERIRLNSSGNLGIGTTTPSTYSRVHIYGSTGQINAPGLLHSQNLDDASALYISNNGNTGQYDRAVFEVYTANGSTNLFKILNGGAISTPRNPAFFARKTNGFTISAATVIVYESEAGDRTSNYNDSNGRFTAPVGGYYYFRAHVQPTTAGVNVNINFWVNGSLISYQSVGTTNLYARGDIANEMVYPLNQNDYVEVVVTPNTSCGFDNHGTFSGYLVG